MIDRLYFLVVELAANSLSGIVLVVGLCQSSYDHLFTLRDRFDLRVQPKDSRVLLRYFLHDCIDVMDIQLAESN